VALLWRGGDAGVSGMIGNPWFKSILKPLRPTFRELAAVSLFINVLALAAPIFVLQVYDRVVFYSGMSTLQGLTIGMAIALVFDFVLRQFRSKLVQRMATKIDVQVSRALFQKLLTLPLRQLELRPASYWMGLFRDIDAVRAAASGPSAFLAADLPFALIFVALSFVIAAPIAWILLLSVFAFMILTWRSGAVLNEATHEERQAGLGRDAMVAEFANTRTIIKALSLDKSVTPVWEKAQAATIEHAIERGGKTDFYANMGVTFTMVTTVLLTVFGAIAIVHQELSVGALIACNMLSSRILQPLNQLFGTWRSYALSRASIQRLSEVFAVEGERQSSEVKLPRPLGKVLIEDVTFRYLDDDVPVLDGVKLSFQPGGIHLLLGRNGSGKTTLLKAILGLYRPSSGRVLLDGADIAQFARSDLSAWIGYVPQETTLFSGTIRDNIVKGAEDVVDDDMIVRAAKLAGLHQVVIDLPKGYATEIGEAGTLLSGGFRQRVMIARALVRDPPVLVLDEPSSNLDRQAEEELRQGLLELARDHTVIIATHSPVLLAAAHTVAAIDRGKVLIAGPAAEVLPRLSGRPQPVPAPGAALAAAPAGAALAQAGS
jgi:ATP-binding cassette subfamily C protein LapB